MVEYNDRLLHAMDESGMSPTQLADKLDVSYQAVKKVLDGKSGAFSAPNNAQAARLLGVSSDWLALGTGPMRGESSTPWPFQQIDQAKVAALGRHDLARLEAAIIYAAGQAGIDIISPLAPRDAKPREAAS